MLRGSRTSPNVHGPRPHLPTKLPCLCPPTSAKFSECSRESSGRPPAGSGMAQSEEGGMPTADIQATDIVVSTEDGVNLRGRLWKGPRPRAIAVIAHGFGEHGGSYAHVAEELAAVHAIDVLAVDFRGHGR